MTNLEGSVEAELTAVAKLAIVVVTSLRNILSRKWSALNYSKTLVLGVSIAHR